MLEPHEADLLEYRIATDLAGFAERFLQAVAAHGSEARESLLGGYVEWLGLDLVDALVFLPADRGRELDALAERFLEAARQVLQGGVAVHAPAVAAVVRECCERCQCTGRRNTRRCASFDA